MADLRLAKAAASAALDRVTGRLDDGYLRIYTGSPPATVEAVLADQVLLAELRWSSPAFRPASGGVATANAITPEQSARATGEASWFRAVASDGSVVFDDAIGTGLTLDTTEIVEGAKVSVVEYSLTLPLED